MDTMTSSTPKKLTEKQAAAARKRELKQMFEDLGSTPSVIINRLYDKKCRFGVVAKGKGCIMQQFFKKSGLDSERLFTTLNDVNPSNRRAIDEVININDVVKPN